MIQAGLNEANWTRLRNSGSSRFPRCTGVGPVPREDPGLFCFANVGKVLDKVLTEKYAHALAGVGRILREYFHSDSSSS